MMRQNHADSTQDGTCVVKMGLEEKHVKGMMNNNLFLCGLLHSAVLVYFVHIVIC